VTSWRRFPNAAGWCTRRHAAREDRLGSETQIGRHRPHLRTPSRRRTVGSESGRSSVGCAPQSVRDESSRGRRSRNRTLTQASTSGQRPRSGPTSSCLARTDRSEGKKVSRRERPGRFHGMPGPGMKPGQGGVEEVERPRIGRGASSIAVEETGRPARHRSSTMVQ